MQADLSSMRAGELRAPNPAGFHTVRYVEHGARDAARTVVCVHGLTRNGRDFDPLAGALAAAGFRVVCPDIVGRGRSDRLADPAGYNYGQYQQDMMALIAHLGVGTVDWVGTSMGGLIGMLLAAQEGSPVERLVINDIGPKVARETLGHIRSYLGLDLQFRDLGELEAHLRLIHAPFGPLSDGQWRALAEHSARRAPEGLRLHYDPAIREAFAAAADTDTDLWAVWDRIGCPVLVIRGADSALLTGDILAEMRSRKPALEVATFAGIGHAPALMDPAQIAAITGWLGL